MLRVFTWMGRVWGDGGAKSSLLPLTSLCVSSPTHTCSPHWISFPFSNRKKPVLIFTFSIFARSLRRKIKVFSVMRCWSEWKDWSSRAHNLIYIIYNLISWLTRKQQNIYSTALGTKAELFVNWGKMHKITHSHSRGSLLSLNWTKLEEVTWFWHLTQKMLRSFLVKRQSSSNFDTTLRLEDKCILRKNKK